MTQSFAVLEFYQESNSFNPKPMGWRHFEACSVGWGRQMAEKASADSAVGGMRAALANSSADARPLYLGSAIGMCGGRIADDVLQRFWEGITGQARLLDTSVDGVLLILHGACAAQSHDDVEGWILEAARAQFGDVPFVLALDHHANITRTMMRHADVIVGYRTEPHYPYETGLRATRILLAMLTEGLRPAMAWRKIPMITPMDRFETNAGPMQRLFDLAIAAESEPGVLDVSPFPMQPWLDVAEGGWAVVAVTDGTADPQLVADKIAAAAWEMRSEFWESTGVTTEHALADFRPGNGMLVLHDTGDSVFAGSTGASVALLEALLRDAPDVPALISVADSAAVACAWEAGAGARTAVRLGGDAISTATLDLAADVVGLTEGPVTFDPFYALDSVDEGRSALLRVGPHLINVSEIAVFGGNDPALYARYGIDPGMAKLAVVKIAADYNRFGRWRTGKIRVNSPGCSQHDLAALPFTRVPRPIYGLDHGVAWSVGTR